MTRRALAAVVSRAIGVTGIPRGRMIILIYHRVHPGPDPMFPAEPTPEVFRWQMELLASHACPLGLSEAAVRLRDGTLPPRAVAVTFDDGYADNAEIAAPILREVGVPATFFVSTGFLDGGRMWNDTVIESVRIAKGPAIDLRVMGLGARESVGGWTERRDVARRALAAIKHRPQIERQRLADAVAEQVDAALPDALMMTGDQVRGLAEAGFEIGAHTVSHPILRVLDEPQARTEVEESRRFLEKLTGRRVGLFAYPNGRRGEDYGERDVEIVRDAGFQAAVSTNRGAAHAASDLFQLPRFTPWDRTPERFLGRLLWEYRNAA